MYGKTPRRACVHECAWTCALQALTHTHPELSPPRKPPPMRRLPPRTMPPPQRTSLRRTGKALPGKVKATPSGLLILKRIILLGNRLNEGQTKPKPASFKSQSSKLNRDFGRCAKWWDEILLDMDCQLSVANMSWVLAPSIQGRQNRSPPARSRKWELLPGVLLPRRGSWAGQPGLGPGGTGAECRPSLHNPGSGARLI